MTRKATPCQLPYPEKFDKAVEFYEAWNGRGKTLGREAQLLLYALHQQATQGPCTEAKPWSWNPVEQAKWHAWSGLKDMDRMEAMRLFVKTLEEEMPHWYGELLQPSEETGELPTQPSFQGLDSIPSDGMWKTPWVSAEQHPHPRFEHAACVFGNSLYMFGGNCAGGRYLSDIWELNLDTLSWSCVTESFQGVPAQPDAPAPRLPASAAMVALPHRGRILLIGGHTKAKDVAAALAVRVLDPSRGTWSELPCDGDVPRTRGGHAACLIADKVYLVGGEDPARRLAAGVHVLDLATNTWAEFEAKGDPLQLGPSPRSALVATAYQDRYMAVFGGGSAAHCHQDLWVLDTESGVWDQPVTSGGPPAARAGCCAALLGHVWCVLGGGNNAAGCPDMWTLDLSFLGSGSPLPWHRVCEFDDRSALASEGGALCAAPAYGALLAFGGYNGHYHNALSVFKPEPSDFAGVGEGGRAALAAREPEIRPAEKQPNGAAQPSPTRESELDSARRMTAAALEDALSAKEAAQQEVALMRKQLSSAQAAKEVAEAGAREAREALAAEQDKSFKLEVRLSELAAQLETMAELQAEVDKYKTLLAEREKKGGAGLWGYISGA